MSTFAIGVDLGGTNLRIAAVDERGTLLEKTTTGTQVARGRDFVIGEMCEAIRATAAKFSASTLAGIGIGVPGIIDMDTGMLRESPNLPGWHDYPVRDEIERRLGTKVILENDANSAALGEKWLGAARDYDDMLMLTLGTGVGGGIVLRRPRLARDARHGGRAGAHHGRARGAAMSLRQPRMPGAVRFRHRRGAHGAGSHRPRRFARAGARFP